MKRYMPIVAILLLAGLLASCGGGGGGSSSVSSTGTGGDTPSGPALPTAGMRVEESDAAVALTGPWTKSDSSWGWSGGSAMQSTAAGATA